MGRLITVSEPLPAEMLSKLKKDAHELGFDVLYEADKKKAEEHLAETEIFFGKIKTNHKRQYKYCLQLERKAQTKH